MQGDKAGKEGYDRHGGTSFPCLVGIGKEERDLVLTQRSSDPGGSDISKSPAGSRGNQQICFFQKPAGNGKKQCLGEEQLQQAAADLARLFFDKEIGIMAPVLCQPQCRILEKKLDGKYTPQEITQALRKMYLCDIEGSGYIPAYTRTKLTDDLHDTFGFNTDTQIIKKAKMRSIISKTKKR